MKLKIIHHNVRLWNNPDNINQNSNYYIQEDADIITINLHDITKQDKYVKLHEYSAYTKNKERNSGVAILIKHNIIHTFHHITTNKNTLAATVNTSHGKITIITFYRPPRHKFLPILDIQKFLNYNNPTQHNTTDKTGKLLKNLCTTLNLHYLGPDFNTFYRHTLKGKPDIILCNTSFLYMAHYIEEGP